MSTLSVSPASVYTAQRQVKGPDIRYPMQSTLLQLESYISFLRLCSNLVLDFLSGDADEIATTTPRSMAKWPGQASASS